jgi:hypothetical protein
MWPWPIYACLVIPFCAKSSVCWEDPKDRVMSFLEMHSARAKKHLQIGFRFTPYVVFSCTLPANATFLIYYIYYICLFVVANGITGPYEEEEDALKNLG